MRAKDYLNQIRKLDVCVGKRIAELNQLRERMSLIAGIDYSKDRIQSSPSSGNRQVEDLVDFEIEIAALVRKEADMKQRIISEVQMLENPIHVDLLLRRYVDCLSFERIACDMGYAYNYVCNMHGKALEEFERKVFK